MVFRHDITVKTCGSYEIIGRQIVIRIRKGNIERENVKTDEFPYFSNSVRTIGLNFLAIRSQQNKRTIQLKKI